MRWTLLLVSAWFAFGLTANAVESRIVKVLPLFLDQQGRESVSPSLYDRDAYQARLRRNPKQRSGMIFDIQWKSSVPRAEELKLRVELRGEAFGAPPRTLTLEQILEERHRFSHWTGVPLAGDTYRQFGEVTAWRVTLWNRDQLLSEQKSFLW